MDRFYSMEGAANVTHTNCESLGEGGSREHARHDLNIFDGTKETCVSAAL